MGMLIHRHRADHEEMTNGVVRSDGLMDTYTDETEEPNPLDTYTVDRRGETEPPKRGRPRKTE